METTENPKVMARASELASTNSKAGLVKIAKATPRVGDDMFPTVWSILSSHARKDELAYFIARTEIQGQ